MRAIFSVLSVLLLAAGLVTGQTTEPDALRQVWERMIEAKGGRARLLEVDSLLLVHPQPGGRETRYVLLYAFPDRWWIWGDTRLDWPFFSLSLSVFSRDGLWRVDQTRDEEPRTPTWDRPDAGDYQTRPIDVQALHLFETRWLQPELLRLESERIGFRRYDVITVDVGYRLVRYYIDRETSLVRRIQMVNPYDDRIFDSWDLEDYVPVDGIMMPSRMEDTRGGGGRREWEFSFNVDYDPEVFSPPPGARRWPGGLEAP